MFILWYVWDKHDFHRGSTCDMKKGTYFLPLLCCNVLIKKPSHTYLFLEMCTFLGTKMYMLQLRYRKVLIQVKYLKNVCGHQYYLYYLKKLYSGLYIFRYMYAAMLSHYWYKRWCRNTFAWKKEIQSSVQHDILEVHKIIFFLM